MVYYITLLVANIFTNYNDFTVLFKNNFIPFTFRLVDDAVFNHVVNSGHHLLLVGKIQSGTNMLFYNMV